MVKKLLGAVIFSSLLVATGWAATPSPSTIATPPQPKWNELSVQQKIILAPLASDWDALESYRRKKWIGITQRFPGMTPEEQQRIQGQMQEWTKLTPDQRRQAREKFQTVTQLPAKEKAELKQKWEAYSNLPDDEKEKLKQQAVSQPAPRPGRASAAGTVAPQPAGLPSVPAAPPAPTAVAPAPAGTEQAASQTPASPATATEAETAAPETNPRLPER